MWTDSTQSPFGMTLGGSAGARERDLVVWVTATEGLVGVERVGEAERGAGTDVARTYRYTNGAKTRRRSRNSPASGEPMAGIKTASRSTRVGVRDRVRPGMDTPTPSIAH
jgi:hypothetical protein